MMLHNTPNWGYIQRGAVYTVVGRLSHSYKMKAHLNLFVLCILVITGVMPLSSCAPSITRDIAEKEIITFTLELIIQQQTTGSIQYRQNSGEPWLSLPPKANLIIYAPANPEKDKADWEQLDKSNPFQVWWYFDGNLVETQDRQLAIQEWQQYYQYELKAKSWPDRYEFGILSVSRNNKNAKIYFSSSTCPECAAGFIYTLRRNNSGQWEIVDKELLWVS